MAHFIVPTLNYPHFYRDSMDLIRKFPFPQKFYIIYRDPVDLTQKYFHPLLDRDKVLDVTQKPAKNLLEYFEIFYIHFELKVDFDIEFHIQISTYYHINMAHFS